MNKYIIPGIQKTQGRYTIGFLTANVHFGAARVLWPGILDAAEHHDVNLICYPGGQLQTTDEVEMQRHSVYRLVDMERLDGLVSWVSAIGGMASPAEVHGFHELHRSIPVVSLASVLESGPVISIDSYEGMRDLVFHLIEKHHYQRLALICGPEGHPYALERRLAFIDALKEKGLDPDPNLITPPFDWNQGAAAMQLLLDERQLRPGIDFVAVVAASDLLAIGALRLMVERGIRVPTDVALAGFSDIEEGKLVRPPLTSVSLPFYEQGRRSVETLLDIFSGQMESEHLVLKSSLLVRQSCGCLSKSIDLAGAEVDPVEENDMTSALKRVQAQLLNEIIPVIHSEGLAATWIKQLLDAFRSEIAEQRRGRFQTALDGMLQQGVLDDDETGIWQNAISILRRDLVPALAASHRPRAEALLGQARIVIGDGVQRAQIARQLQTDRQNSVLRDIGQQLITTFDIEKLANVLVERLPELDIRSCYLALYEHQGDPTAWARMVLAYSDNNLIAIEQQGLLFPSRQLIPPDLLPRRRYSLLVAPLFFGAEALGFVVFEIGPRDGHVYEVLRGHISTAVKGALLFREADQARCKAERADQIKTRLLANVSHELRTPLNIIINHSQRLRTTPSTQRTYELDHIQQSAEHQLRIINDLLDLSRAEINALDLYPVILDPVDLITEVYTALAKVDTYDLSWHLELPQHLPSIEADPVRLRQILLNLLSNAARFTSRGRITVGAEQAAAHLHIWVADTGAGIPPELVDRIYEPFTTHERSDHPPSGIGLGLSITKHLVELHGGFMALDSQPGQGSLFHVYLPLPESERVQSRLPQSQGVALWLVSRQKTTPENIAAYCSLHQLELERLSPDTQWEVMLTSRPPAIVAWDMTATIASDWAFLRRLQNHPRLGLIPFILYRQDADEDAADGFTSLTVKPSSAKSLWEAIQPSVPQTSEGVILIVDDDPKALELTRAVVAEGLPGFTIRTAADGAEALASMFSDPPSLVILDLMMPVLDGFEVLNRMRTDERTQSVPVVIMSARRLSLNDIKRLEQHTAVTLQNKEILTGNEVIASLHRSLFGEDTLPPQTSALVKRAVAYLHQNYDDSLARGTIAEGIGVSEDYLSRVFKHELGISLWDYLNRYRISRSKNLLRSTNDSISQIGRRVGFSDPAYFSRVFRRLTGDSPRNYRNQPHK